MAKIRMWAAALAALLLLGSLPARAGTPLVAENLELETYRGVSVGGQLAAAGGEGGALHFEITTEPCKGSVELTADGSFVYTPEADRRGRDYFGYKAMDGSGNVSQEATVIIRLVKCRAAFRYADTVGLPCDYAAHALAEQGLLQGQCVAGSRLFEPGRSISRGEFLSLCMEAAGREAHWHSTATGFRDDGEIGLWLKPYVSAALMAGYCSGEADFAGDTALGREEAALLLSAVFELTDAPGEAADEAARAVMNLSGSGIPLAPGDTPLTRGEAAIMLTEAMG